MNKYQAQLNQWRNQVIAWSGKVLAKLHEARTRDVDFSSVKLKCNEYLSNLRQLKQRDFKITLADIRPWLHQHGRKVSIYVGMPLLILVVWMFGVKQIHAIYTQVSLKPAQLAALETLIQDSKLNGANTPSTPPLTDVELETLRVILQTRGITPNILRLNLDNGIGIEIQIDQASFGQWIAFLDEASRRWHLYPMQLTIKAGDGPEVVSIRGLLQQSQDTAP